MSTSSFALRTREKIAETEARDSMRVLVAKDDEKVVQFLNKTGPKTSLAES